MIQNGTMQDVKLKLRDGSKITKVELVDFDICLLFTFEDGIEIRVEVF
ncbi:hypothetical protein LCGC14_1505570 [marine sediment metagenome]|uniref:Uncharacterized protein n=1 Tax=marine sediment metagenome TaxID=412755 RepID=A0A0F9M461_9ZZZZ